MGKAVLLKLKWSPLWDVLLGECVKQAEVLVGCEVSHFGSRKLRITSIEADDEKKCLNAILQVDESNGSKIKWTLKRVLIRIDSQKVPPYVFELNKVFSRLLVMRSVWVNNNLRDKTKLKYLKEVQEISECLEAMNRDLQSANLNHHKKNGDCQGEDIETL